MLALNNGFVIEIELRFMFKPFTSTMSTTPRYLIQAPRPAVTIQGMIAEV